MTLAGMTPLRRALAAVGIAGIVMGIVAFVVVAKSEAATVPLLEANLTILIGWSFIGTGLFAWDRRPSNLIGPLMVCVGFAWFLSELKVSDIPFVAVIGFACNSLAVGFLIHLLIVFPGGRARGRLDRFFIGYAYVAGGLVAAIPVLFYNPPSDPDCTGCTSSNPLLISDNLDLVHGIFNTLSAVSIPVLAALIVHLVRRARAADAEERRSQAPVWWAGGATILLFAAALLTNLGPEQGNYDDVVWYLANVVIATVPFAFLLGLLRTRLSDADLVAEENVRLDAELQARLDDLRESRARIVQAGDAARRKLERDLHDGAQQRLVHSIIVLKQASHALRSEQEPASRLVAEALEQAENANVELRELAHGILPSDLTRGGLRAGVGALASRTPVPVEVDVLAERLPTQFEATAYFVVAEALTNVAKHSGAGHAAVTARVENGTLRVHVRDDGSGGARQDGSGLLGLADRLAVLDGRLRVENPPDGGTLIAADIPLRD